MVTVKETPNGHLVPGIMGPPLAETTNKKRVDSKKKGLKKKNDETDILSINIDSRCDDGRMNFNDRSLFVLLFTMR